MIAMIDGRTELKPMKPAATAGVEDDDLESGGCAAAGVPLIRRHLVDSEHLLAEQYSISEVTVMASKIAYENAAYIENVVNNVWKVYIYSLRPSLNIKDLNILLILFGHSSY